MRLPLALLLVCAFFLVIGEDISAASQAMEERFIRLTNGTRAEHGVPKLRPALDAAAVAQDRSDEMARRGRIWHSDGLRSRLRGWVLIGENVGKGPSVDSLHTAFVRSEPHLSNIVLPSYDEIGVGVTMREETIYVSLIFLARPSRTRIDPPVAHHGPVPAAPGHKIVRPNPRASVRTVAVLERLVAESEVVPRRTFGARLVAAEARPSRAGVATIPALLLLILALPLSLRRKSRRDLVPPNQMLAQWARWRESAGSPPTLAHRTGQHPASRSPRSPEVRLGLGVYLRLGRDSRAQRQHDAASRLGRSLEAPDGPGSRRRARGA